MFLSLKFLFFANPKAINFNSSISNEGNYIIWNLCKNFSDNSSLLCIKLSVIGFCVAIILKFGFFS